MCSWAALSISLCVAAGHGGGWGYSAHSVEAIRFCADADILLGGLGLFGGRGEYTAKIKVGSLFNVIFNNNLKLLHFLKCSFRLMKPHLSFASNVPLYSTPFVIELSGPSVVQLFELGPDGGDHETDGDLLAETDVLAYDCAAR